MRSAVGALNAVSTTWRSSGMPKEQVTSRPTWFRWHKPGGQWRRVSIACVRGCLSSDALSGILSVTFAVKSVGIEKELLSLHRRNCTIDGEEVSSSFDFDRDSQPTEAFHNTTDCLVFCLLWRLHWFREITFLCCKRFEAFKLAHIRLILRTRAGRTPCLPAEST